MTAEDNPSLGGVPFIVNCAIEIENGKIYGIIRYRQIGIYGGKYEMKIYDIS